MDINFEAKLHNKFKIEVCDAKTGELKQTAYAYNVILNRFFYQLLVDKRRYVPNLIYVGSGSGTPAITDTDMFHTEATKGQYSSGWETQTIYGYPTSRKIYKAKLESTECVGKTLTEVGLGFNEAYWGTYPSTHAMIQDAEGQQISISKTDTDVVWITAVFYCTVTNSGFGNNAVYPTTTGSALAAWILNGSEFQTVYGSKLTFQTSNEIETKYSHAKSFTFYNGTGNATNLTYTIPQITVLDSEWNNSLIKSFGFSGVGLFKLPDSSAFPDYTVDHTTIGVGDGATTEFNIKCPLIKNGTVHVYVNSVEVPSTDYTVDLNSNCCDSYENYYTAEMEATGESGQVVFGNYPTITGSRSVYDPFIFGAKEGWVKDGKTYQCTVNAANPIWIDFGSAKECNKAKITRESPPALTIECSNDNSTWDAVSATTESGVYSFAKTSARYWRIYPTSGDWNPYLSNHSSLDGTDTGAFVFLGKTVPGLTFNTPPAANALIEASYKLDVPFKTSNNLLRISCTIQLQRG